MPTAFDDLLVDAPNDQFDDLLADEPAPKKKAAALPQEEPAQPLPETALNQLKRGFLDLAAKPAQFIANTQQAAIDLAGQAPVIGPAWKGALEMLPAPARTVAPFMQDIAERRAEMSPVDPRNKITSTVAGAVPQAIGMMATGGAAGVPAVLALGGMMGGQQGYETADEIGVTSPLGKMATAAAFAGAEAGIESMGGIGGKQVVGSIGKRFLHGATSETLEEPATGFLQDAVTRIAATDTGNGQTATGYDLSQLSPTDPRYWEKRGLETLGGAAGGTIFAGVQALGDLAQPQQAPVQQGEPQGPDEIDAAMQEIAGTSIESGESIVPDLSSKQPEVTARGLELHAEKRLAELEAKKSGEWTLDRDGKPVQTVIGGTLTPQEQMEYDAIIAATENADAVDHDSLAAMYGVGVKPKTDVTEEAPQETEPPVVDQAALDAEAERRRIVNEEYLKAIEEKHQAQIEALPEEKLDNLIRQSQLRTNAAAVANDPAAADEQEFLDRLRAEKVRRNPPPSQQVAEQVASVDPVAAETGIQVSPATLAAVDAANKLLQETEQPAPTPPSEPSPKGDTAVVFPAAPNAAPAQEPSPPVAGAAFTSRNAEMLPDTDTFGGKFDEPLNINPSSYVNKDGIETVEYTNPRTGEVDVYISAFGDKDFIAYMRQYDENGNPTNRWTSKLERRTKRAGATKAMLQELQSRLPAGHQYTEDSSVSTDGLRFIAGQLRQGYTVVTNLDGSPQTSEVAISGESITNDLPVAVDPNGKFENIRITSPAEFAKVKKYLGKMLESFGVGLNENNVRWENGTAFIDLPVLQSTTRPSSQTRDYEPGSEDPKESPPDAGAAPIQETEQEKARREYQEYVDREYRPTWGTTAEAETTTAAPVQDDRLTEAEMERLRVAASKGRLDEEVARMNQELSKNVLTDASTPVTGGGMETPPSTSNKALQWAEPATGQITSNVADESDALRGAAIRGERITPEEAESLWNETEVIEYAWRQEFNSDSRRTGWQWDAGWDKANPQDALRKRAGDKQPAGRGDADFMASMMTADEYLAERNRNKPLVKSVDEILSTGGGMETTTTQRDATKPEQMTPEELAAFRKSESIRIAQEALDRAKSGQEVPNVFVNGFKSKAALVRARQSELDAAQSATMEPDVWQTVVDAASNKKPISAGLVESLSDKDTVFGVGPGGEPGGTTPSPRKQLIENLASKGYQKQGDLYVFQPETPPQAPQETTPQAAAETGVVEARSEEGGERETVLELPKIEEPKTKQPKPKQPKPSESRIAKLVEEYNASGRVAFRYPRKGTISIDGTTLSEADAVSKMERVLAPAKPSAAPAPAKVESGGGAVTTDAPAPPVSSQTAVAASDIVPDNGKKASRGTPTTEPATFAASGGTVGEAGITQPPSAGGESGSAKVSKVYLNVPFTSKESAKTLGAKWDADEKLWYVLRREDGSVPPVPDRWLMDEGVALRDKEVLKAARINAEQKYGKPVEIAPVEMVSGTAYALRFTGGDWLNSNVSKEEARATKAAQPEKTEPAKPDSSAAFEIIKNAYPFKTTQTPSEERSFLKKVKDRLKPLGIAGWKIDSAVESIKLRRAQSGGGKLFYVDPTALHAELLRNGDVARKPEATTQQEEPSKPPDAGAPRTIAKGDKVKFKQEGILQSGTYQGVNADGTYSVQVKGEKVPRHVSARSLNENNESQVEGTTTIPPKTLNPTIKRKKRGDAGFIDVEAISHGIELYARGVKDFASWSARMVKRFGEAVRTHLKSIYQSITKGGFTNEQQHRIRQWRNKRREVIDSIEVPKEGGQEAARDFFKRYISALYAIGKNQDGSMSFGDYPGLLPTKLLFTENPEERTGVTTSNDGTIRINIGLVPQQFASSESAIKESMPFAADEEVIHLIETIASVGDKESGVAVQMAVDSLSLLIEAKEAIKSGDQSLAPAIEGSLVDSWNKYNTADNVGSFDEIESRIGENPLLAINIAMELSRQLIQFGRTGDTTETINQKLIGDVESLIAKSREALLVASTLARSGAMGGLLQAKIKETEAVLDGIKNQPKPLNALPTGNRAMPLDKARAHVYNKLRASPRKVRVINEPSLKFRGRYDPDGTITLNSAYLGSVEELNDVLLNHESIHDAIETDDKVRKQADKLLGALTEDERADIEADILDYKDGEFSAEQVQAERQVEAIRKLTANRPDLQSAWGRLVESVSLSFKKLLGVNVSRQQAELAAARILARGLKRLRKGKTGGRTQGGGSLYQGESNEGEIYRPRNIQSGKAQEPPSASNLDGTGLIGADAQVLGDTGAGTLAEVLARAARYGVGPKTVARAAVTASAIQGKDGAIREAANRIAAVRPLYQASPSDVTRFKQLTASIPPKPTPEQLETWKQEHPAEYKELEAMREMVLREQGYTVGPVKHRTKGDFTVFDLTKASQSSVWGPAIYATLGGSWNPAILEGSKLITGYVGGRVIDLSSPLSSDDASRLSDAVGREVKDSVPLITLERRFGSVAEGLKAAGYDAAIHSGPGATGKHIAVFSPSQIKSADPLATDDSGNLITPEAWGDETSPDIRYASTNIQATGGEDSQPLSPTDNSLRAREIREAAAGINWGTATRSEKKAAVDAFGRKTLGRLRSGNAQPDATVVIASGEGQSAHARLDGIIDGKTLVVIQNGYGNSPNFATAEQAMAHAYDTSHEEMIHALQYIASVRRWKKAGSIGEAADFVRKESEDALSEIKAAFNEAKETGNTELASKIDSMVVDAWNLYNENHLPSLDAVMAEIEGGAGLSHQQFYSEVTRQLMQVSRNDFTTETGWQRFVTRVKAFLETVISRLKDALNLAKKGTLGPTIQQEINDLDAMMKDWETTNSKPLYSLPKKPSAQETNDEQLRFIRDFFSDANIKGEADGYNKGASQEVSSKAGASDSGDKKVVLGQGFVRRYARAMYGFNPAAATPAWASVDWTATPQVKPYADGRLTIGFNASRVIKEMGIKMPAEAEAKFTADSIDEEMIHLADAIALRQAWIKTGRRGSFNKFLIQHSNDLLSEVAGIYLNGTQEERDAIDNAFAASRHAYTNEPKNFKQFFGHIQDINNSQNAAESHKFTSEFVRQIVQIRRSGEITETGWQRIKGAVSRFLQQSLDLLKQAAGLASNGAFGKILQKRIADVEAMLETINLPENDATGSIDAERGGMSVGAAKPTEPYNEKQDPTGRTKQRRVLAGDLNPPTGTEVLGTVNPDGSMKDVLLGDDGKPVYVATSGIYDKETAERIIEASVPLIESIGLETVADILTNPQRLLDNGIVPNSALHQGVAMEAQFQANQRYLKDPKNPANQSLYDKTHNARERVGTEGGQSQGIRGALIGNERYQSMFIAEALYDQIKKGLVRGFDTIMDAQEIATKIQEAVKRAEEAARSDLEDMLGAMNPDVPDDVDPSVYLNTPKVKDKKTLAERMLEKDSPELLRLVNKIKGDVSWKEILGDPKLRMRERMAGIFDRVRKHEALQDLSPAEQQQLTVELERLLQKQRLKQVNKDLNEAGLNLPKKAEKAVRDSMPELLRLINLGTFSAETFRDAIAPKFGLKTLSSKEVKRVEEIAAKINDAPAGMPKRQLQDELLKAMQDITSATKSQIALQYWVSSVLSGGRTQFDTALSFLNGTRKFLQGASLAAMRGEGKVVGQAFQRYFKGLHDGMMEAAYYFRTGDPTMLLNFDAEMNAYLKGGQNEAHPYRLSEKIWSDAKKSGNWLKIPPAAVIMSVNRMMQSWDHINARATSRGFLPLAVAYNRKLYSDLKVPDQADYKAAEQQAEQILGKPKTWGEKVKVRAMANEILDASVSEDNKVRDSIINEAIDIGRTASYQNDPTGIIGTLYHGIKNTTANIIRKAEAAAQEASKTAAKTGTKIDKTKAQAMNLVAFSSRFVEPIAGTMFLRFVGNRFNELISLTPGLGAMRLWEKEMNETKKAMIYTDQAVGSLLYALGAVALYAMLSDDDDEDKRGWRIEGGWQGVDRAKQRQMLSEGRTPYSLAFKNKDGSWGTLKYGNWPVASILATVGGMSDKSKYRPKEWNEDSYAAHVANAIFGGITAISDISAISALMETLGGTQYGKDPVEGLRDRVNATMANFAGGFIPRAAKDLDYLSNPAHNKPDDLMSFWLKEIPVYRRSVGAPMMDVFGRQVQLRREPWSRAYLPGPIEPEYQIAGKMASRGLFLPLSDPDQRVVGKGKNRRDMTPEEKGRYVEEVGSLYKDFVLRYGDKVLDMEPDKARDFIASHLSEARNKAEKRAVR